MSPRYSVVRADHVEYGFWLVFDEAGGVRMSRGEPFLSRGERAMNLTAKLPRSLFATPQLRATINVVDGSPEVKQIDVGAAERALKHALGVDIDLRVNPPPEAE
jgi:hypothetical protein